MSICRAFFGYCTTHHRALLLASFASVVGYVFNELERGMLAPTYLSKYLSAVASLHTLVGHADSTKHKRVQLALFGYRSHALERAGGELALQWMPLPADYMLRVCILGLSTPNAYLSLQGAMLVLGYLMF